MKTAIAPHLVKFGRRRPKQRARLQLSKYLRAAEGCPSWAAIPVPETCDYSPAGQPALSNVYLNDQLGDCVIAAGYHLVALETGNAGAVWTASNTQIIADYSAIGGYKPGDPSTDQGCDEQTAFAYWGKTGWADGSVLQGYVGVDASNQAEIQAAMYLFENLFFGMELPDAWISPFPSNSGFVWDAGTPNPDNGHAFIGTGYDAIGVQIDTWGLEGTITWAAIAALCKDGGELYTLLSPDQIEQGRTLAPNGLDWLALTRDFESL
jgi:hypothetical protein